MLSLLHQLQQPNSTSHSSKTKQRKQKKRSGAGAICRTQREMEGRRGNMGVCIIMIMGVVAMQLHSSRAQTTHTVLDSSGWIIPSSPNAYTTWAASKTFTLGDTLEFNFPSGVHTVAEVTKAAYDACTLTAPISTWTAPPARVPLNSSGPHYYLCTVTGHCSAGQKLAVTVVSAATTVPPTPPPTATPSSPTPAPVAAPPRSVPAPSPTTTPTPSPSPSTAPSPSPSTAPTPSPSTTPTPSPASSPTATPPAPSSEDTTPSATPPASDTTPPPPPPNAAVSLAAGVLPVTILSVVMAVLY